MGCCDADGLSCARVSEPGLVVDCTAVVRATLVRVIVAAANEPNADVHFLRWRGRESAITNAVN